MLARHVPYLRLASLPAKILSSLLNKNNASSSFPINIISNNLTSKNSPIIYTGHHLSDKAPDYWTNYILASRNGIASSEGTDQSSETDKDSRSRHQDEVKISVDKELSNEKDPAKRLAIIEARLISEDFTKRMNEVSEERVVAEEISTRHWQHFVLAQQQKDRQLLQNGHKPFVHQITNSQLLRT